MTKYQFVRQCLHGLDNPTIQELGKVLNSAQMPTPTQKSLEKINQEHGKQCL